MRYVVIGASAAGINGAENIRRLDNEGEIILISIDTKVYSRCIIHHYISGERSAKDIDFVGEDFFSKNDIKWIKGREVISLDENKKIVCLDDGQEIDYDRLLIASGSRSFIPPIENLRGASNVIGLRTLEDSDKIIEMAKRVKSIAVVGAGLIGIDAIVGLIHLKGIDAKLSLIETRDRLLPTQLDKEASMTYERELIKNNVDLYLESFVEKANLDSNKVVSLKLRDKRLVEAELVIVATGVRSNIEFLEGTSIEVGKAGLIYNTRGETNIEDIYGAGDVSGVAPIWPVAVKEGIVASSNMVGVDRKMDDFFYEKATMNFFNIPTMSLGDVVREDREYQDEGYSVDIEKNTLYKKVIHKDGIIYGAIIQGDLAYAGILTQLIRGKIDISRVEKSIFKIDYSDFFNMKENHEFTY